MGHLGRTKSLAGLDTISFFSEMNTWMSICNFCVANFNDLCVRFIQGNCNFDTNFCLWKNDLLFSFTWTKLSYDTPSLETGPSFDHTSGDINLNYEA